MKYTLFSIGMLFMIFAFFAIVLTEDKTIGFIRFYGFFISGVVSLCTAIIVEAIEGISKPTK